MYNTTAIKRYYFTMIMIIRKLRVFHVQSSPLSCSVCVGVLRSFASCLQRETVFFNCLLVTISFTCVGMPHSGQDPSTFSVHVLNKYMSEAWLGDLKRRSYIAICNVAWCNSHPSVVDFIIHCRPWSKRDGMWPPWQSDHLTNQTTFWPSHFSFLISIQVVPWWPQYMPRPPW